MPNLCIIPARALRDPDMTPTELRVLLAVGQFTSRDGGGVWASNATLADVAGVDERHLRRALRGLAGRGYIRRVERPGRTSLMGILLDDPPQGGAESAPPGGAESAPQTTHRTTQPPNNNNSTTRVRESLTADAHRQAFDVVARTHPSPALMATALESLTQDTGNGPAYDWPTIGAALLDLKANGQAFSVGLLRGYCRNIVVQRVRPASEPALPATHGRRRYVDPVQQAIDELKAEDAARQGGAA